MNLEFFQTSQVRLFGVAAITAALQNSSELAQFRSTPWFKMTGGERWECLWFPRLNIRRHQSKHIYYVRRRISDSLMRRFCLHFCIRKLEVPKPMSSGGRLFVSVNKRKCFAATLYNQAGLQSFQIFINDCWMTSGPNYQNPRFKCQC